MENSKDHKAASEPPLDCQVRATLSLCCGIVRAGWHHLPKVSAREHALKLRRWVEPVERSAWEPVTANDQVQAGPAGFMAGIAPATDS